MQRPARSCAWEPRRLRRRSQLRSLLLVTKATKDQQVKHVVEGLALGVLAQGVNAVTSAKLEFTSAFNHAWREWPQARHFPGFSEPFPGDLFWIGVGRSERRRGAMAAWDSGPWSEPYLCEGFTHWSVDECLDLHADDRAGVADWKQLGASYISYFKPEDVRRVLNN